MKKFFSISILLAAIFIAPEVYAFDIKDLLKNAASGSSSSDSNNSTASGIGNLLGNLLSSGDVDINEMTGTWNYTAPAVSFQSENLLEKAGGAAAATTIEEKLAPYYKIAGINSMKLTIEADSTFTMALKRGTFTGNITKDEEGNFVFNFKVVKKIDIGKMKTYITKSGNNLSIMFDVSKLTTLVNKAGSITGNSTVQGVSTLLNSYDGICAGFKVAKE
ncbi:MAG: DUF4923 family protein [Muribaculaceae bacterium]|nr:DUF4923 family protein [Muribaculaceae bacterium]